MKRKQPSSKRFPPVPADQFEEYVRIVRRVTPGVPVGPEADAPVAPRPADRGDVRGGRGAGPRTIWPELRKELGDLLLHIVLQATIAEQAGEFTLRDVLAESAEKLMRRHPHVFAQRQGAGHRRRAAELGTDQDGRGAGLGVAGGPARMPCPSARPPRAGAGSQGGVRLGAAGRRLEEGAGGAGGTPREPARRGREEDREEEFGDLLFALVNYARFLDINPEQRFAADGEEVHEAIPATSSGRCRSAGRRRRNRRWRRWTSCGKRRNVESRR